jgi:hypothetical protein
MSWKLVLLLSSGNKACYSLWPRIAWSKRSIRLGAMLPEDGSRAGFQNIILFKNFLMKDEVQKRRSCQWLIHYRPSPTVLNNKKKKTIFVSATCLTPVSCTWPKEYDYGNIWGRGHLRWPFDPLLYTQVRSELLYGVLNMCRESIHWLANILGQHTSLTSKNKNVRGDFGHPAPWHVVSKCQ